MTQGYRGAWWWTLRTVDPYGTILRDIPSLAGAACRGRHELFDDVVREDPATGSTPVSEWMRVRPDDREQPDWVQLVRDGRGRH